jgi:hypothetical protein
MSLINEIAALHDLDLDWGARWQAGTASPGLYHKLISDYAQRAQHMYRRDGVFLAFPLPGLKIWTTNIHGQVEKKVDQGGDLVLRLDNDRYANPKDREKALKDIYRNAAERRLTQDHLNNPDFMGPDIWTWTQKQWGKELPFLVPVPKEPGKYVFADDAWGTTSRLLLPNATTEATAFSYDWGPFALAKNGDLAGYDHEFASVQAAVKGIGDEFKQIIENNPALSTEDAELIKDALIIKHHFKHDEKKGFYVVARDVYCQNPGFGLANFHDKASHDRARAAEGSLVKLAFDAVRRTRQFGLPGHRSNVPTVAEIDVAIAKQLRQQQDAPHAKVA